MFLNKPQLSYRPARIISLVPSLTELLYTLGLEDETIAITKFCVHPKEWYKSKIKIGGTKSVNVKKILSLQPDLIIANKEENVKDQVETLAIHFPVWMTDVNDLNDALQMITDVSQLTGSIKKGKNLIKEIKNVFESLHAHAIAAPAAYLIWKDPLMAAGGNTFINDMMKQAGIINVFSHKSRYPVITIDELRSSGCKQLILSSEPYPFSEKHIPLLQKELPGVEVRLADGEMFSWYGSRLLLSANYFKQFNSK
jgi:ABC-type Fe3+-hydroxamate transport system substrate-binding protein